jgi:uracil-DNA glycosylase
MINSRAKMAFTAELPSITSNGSPKEIMGRTGKIKATYVDISNTFHESWNMVFKNPDYTIEQLLESLYRNGYAAKMKVWPYPSEVLSAFRLPINQVKVVVIGQDPYPGWDSTLKRPVACGKTFATLSKECPGSLKRIINSLTEQGKTVTYSDKEHPYSLQGWVDQGVLLLNRTPVYYHGPPVDLDKPQVVPDVKASSIWEGMTELICRHITEINPTCVFLLVGNEAHTLEPKLGKCVKVNHPSERSSLNFDGDCFRKINCIKWECM